jgi:hypothetical protein
MIIRQAALSVAAAVGSSGLIFTSPVNRLARAAGRSARTRGQLPPRRSACAMGRMSDLPSASVVQRSAFQIHQSVPSIFCISTIIFIPADRTFSMS